MRLKIKCIFIVIATMISLIRCGESTKHEATPDLSVISIPLKESFYQAINYSEIIDTVEYIILEKDNDNALIGKIDKIEFCNGKIFILDRSVTRSIFIFDSNGVFLNKINSIGKGPGEFENPFDITINTNSNELLVYCRSLRKINIYNFKGNFIRDIKISIDFRSFQFINPDKIAVFTHNIYNYLNDYGVLPYNLLIFNLNNKKLIAKQFKTDVKLNEGMVVYSFNNYFAQNGNTILINWLFNDAIYQLNNLIAKPKYLVNFGSHAIHHNDFKNDTEIFRDLLNGTGNLWSIYSSLIITEDYLLFRIIAGKLTEDLENTYFVLFSFLDSKLKVFKNITDNNMMKYFSFPISSFDGYFVSTIYPLEIFDSYSNNNNEIQLPFLKKPIRRYDNPIIQLTKFKKY